MSSTAGWSPTPAHVRAVLGGVFLCVVGVLARRPDLVVLASPLVAVSVWAVVVRPTRSPTATERIEHPTLREGDATRWRVQIEDSGGRIDDVAVVFETSSMVDQQPSSGQVVAGLADDGDAPLESIIRPTRWGVHRVVPALVVAASGWNGFRWVSQDWRATRDLLAFPQPARFDATAPAVHTPGLVGVNRSPRQGTGTEFATVRPFQPGDRLRRIHWVESLRTGSLHVTSSWADHDRHVILLIDAFDDVGTSSGLDGEASSLDIAVRAAAAIAEHYIRVGDRVAVVPLGAGAVPRLRPATGRGHLRRILEVLARIDPAGGLVDTGRLPHGLDSSALIIVLSPLLSAGAQQRLASIADHGFTVVGIDCLPDHLADDDPSDPFADIEPRIARLEREARLRRLTAAGVAVVPWHGPGSLDPVLRELHHRTSPNMRQP